MKKEVKAFTLIEIMIVIALIGILALGITNLSFNSISDKQRLNGFFYKIKTNIETVKNNVLLGREITNSGNIITSNKWQIDFNNSGSGVIKTYYYDKNNNKKNYPIYDINSDKFYEIIIKNAGANITDTGSILIEGANLTLTGITSNNKILEIETKYKNHSKIFTINGISGVIEEK